MNSVQQCGQKSLGTDLKPTEISNLGCEDLVATI